MAETYARLGHQAGGTGDLGHGHHMEIHRLLGAVAVCDGVVIVQYGGGGAKPAEDIAGHHLGVGVEVGDDDVPLRQGAGELEEAAGKHRVGGVVPAGGGVEVAAVMGEGVQLHGAEGIVQRAEGLARPVVILGGGFIEALPRGEVIVGHAGGGGEAGEAAAVAHEDLGGLGDGKNEELAGVGGAVGKEAGDEGGEVALGEAGVPVQQIVLAQLLRVGDVAGEDVGHILHVGTVAEGVLQIGADAGRAGDLRDPDLHALFRAEGAVELLHQTVHGGVRLLAVDVPEGEGDRGVFAQEGLSAAAGEGEGQRKEQKQGKNTLSHGDSSYIVRLEESGRFIVNRRKFFYPPLPFFGGSGYDKKGKLW